MDDLLSEFIAETAESLSALDTKLVVLEKNPNDAASIADIFRVVHTIKGTCGFLDLHRLEAVAHAGEEMLRKFQTSPDSVTSERVTLVLEALDCIKGIIENLEKTGSEPESDNSDLISRLEQEASQESSQTSKPPSKKTDKPSQNGQPQETTQETTQEIAVVSSAAQKQAEEEVESFAAIDLPADLSLSSEEDSTLDIASPWQSAVAGLGQVGATGSAVASLRVRLDLIEQLMNSVSELVLSRNQLLQLLRQNPASEFSAPLQRLNQITTALQEGVMKTRMQPIQNAWSPLPRLVRDLAKTTGKKIRLEMIGAETELDRQIIDMIRDPLIHLIRNAVDHGLEMPAEREQQSKPEEGSISLKAYQEGGQILIEVHDDGRGIDHEKIRNKIVLQGAASEAEAAALTVSQLHRYLFQSGFSTADKITEVSGRGVGMDVVKTNIDKIGGQIELNSTLGSGSQVRIKIPLTLAIVSVLIAKIADQRYAFPQTSVVELVSFRESEDHRVSVLQGNLVLQLRDQLLPLLSIRQLFDLTVRLPEPLGSEKNDEKADTRGVNTRGVNTRGVDTHATNGEAVSESLSDMVAQAVSSAPRAPLEEVREREIPQSELQHRMLQEILQGPENYVVVMRVGAQQFGILVEDIQDTEEIVVKPLSESLRGTPFFSGNTILGDGRVVLIVDPNTLSLELGEGVEEANLALSRDAPQQLEESSVTLVMLDSGDGVKKVVPVSAINRLEHIDCARIEYPNEQATVLYNDALMPVMRIEEGRALPKEGRRPVLVLSDGEKWAGIVVEEVLDIINEPLRIESVGGERGVIGSAILQEQSVEVLDMEHFWKRAFADATSLPIDLSGVAGAPLPPHRERRLLLIERNRAFCDSIIPHLSSVGFRVFVVDHIDQAIYYHKNAIPFDVIISDVDDNSDEVLKFVSRTRQMRDSWSGLPFLALTGMPPTEERTETCRVAGFTDFLSKNDRSDIVRCLKDLPQ